MALLEITPVADAPAVPECVAVLERHRDHLTQSLADLRAARELIDWKLDRYRAATSGAPTPGAA